MENLIFEDFFEPFLRIFGDFSKGFWKNWFVVRTSDLHLDPASWKFSQRAVLGIYWLRYRIKLRFRIILRLRMNLGPKLHMLTCFFGLFRPLFVR